MSPKNKNDAIRDGARKAMDQVKPTAERAKPLARNAGAAARRRILKTRAWAAPQVARSGRVLQDTVAPKVSAVLSSAANKIDPAQPRSRRWKMPVSLATVTTAAGGAVAAFLRLRKKPAVTTSTDPGTGTARPTADNGQAKKTSMGTDTEVNSQVRS
jgi:hypothetical protein